MYTAVAVLCFYISAVLVAAVPARQEITTLATFNASKVFIQDPSVIKPALRLLAALPGYEYSYYGSELENTGIGYLINGWKGQNAGDAAILPLLLKPYIAVGGQKDIEHFIYSADLTNALSANITELATVTLKPGKSKADLIKVVSTQLLPAFDDFPGSHPPSAWAESKEEPGTFSIIAGWDSLEAHEATFSSPIFAPIIPAMLDLVSGPFVHVQFEKYHN